MKTLKTIKTKKFMSCGGQIHFKKEPEKEGKTNKTGQKHHLDSKNTSDKRGVQKLSP